VVFLFTTSDFTQDAIDFGKVNGMRLISGRRLLKLISEFPEDSQNRLFKVATSGDFATPTCPNCGVNMVKMLSKKGSNSGHEFWGCANFPRCKYILNMWICAILGFFYFPPAGRH